MFHYLAIAPGTPSRWVALILMNPVGEVLSRTDVQRARCLAYSEGRWNYCGRQALRLLTQAIHRHGAPEIITIDGSEANEAAIKRYNEIHGTDINIRQAKYLHNAVEQDHRAVKRVTRPMLGFKTLAALDARLR
jgi:DDE domain